MGSYDEAAEHYQLGCRLHEELGENPLARGDALKCLADVARVTQGTGIGPSPATPRRSRHSDRFRMGWWA
jgi:hypothetical protein